jgi:tetratricopeptide (TPR) repeat protein
LEREDWPAAAALTAAPTSYPWEKLPQAEAIVHFARGVGAVKIGDIAAAKASADRLNDLHRALREAKQDYWAEQVAIQESVVSALADFARGNRDGGVAAMRRAVEREAATEKHAVTPGPILPARELLGAMLLELGQAEAALKELEASQKVEPNRLAGVALAAKAADKAGQRDTARAYYQQVLALTQNADPGKRQVAEAKAYLQLQ